MSHTPGPWIVTGVSQDFILGPDGASVAQAHWVGDVPEEAHANAHLIAAAPDLLKALGAIVQVLDGRQPQDIPGAIMVAQSAIAKAEGR